MKRAVLVDLGAQPLDFLADGDDLLALRRSTSTYALVRVAADGTVSAGTEVGIGDPTGKLARLGANALVVWSRPAVLQLALVAP